MNSLSILIPVYNEAEAIEAVLREIREKVAAKFSSVEFIVCEDGSTDGTKEILSRLEKELGLTLVSGSERKGYGRAAREGLKMPSKEFVFFTDSDGQHDPTDFWKLWEQRDNCDIVVGVKTPRLDPPYRLVMSKIMQLVNWALFGIRLHDANCGFRLISKRAIDDVLPRMGLLGNFPSVELILRAHRAGFRVREMPVSHRPRLFGESRGLPARKIPRETLRLLRGLWQLRRELATKGHEIARNRQ